MRDLLSAGVPLPWVGGIAAAVLAVGLLLIVSGHSMRRRRGLTGARTLDLDGRNLYSARYGLAGRPDRIVEEGGLPIPEEWKSGRRVHDSHRVQLGVYLILIEEETGIRPPHGYVVLGEVGVSASRIPTSSGPAYWPSPTRSGRRGGTWSKSSRSANRRRSAGDTE